MADAKRETPLTHVETLALQNVFDEDPRLRAAYLKKHGFEMNPSDDNQYKPIGGQNGWMEVDPGFHAQFQKQGLKGIGQEILDKLGNNAFDLGVKYPAMAAAAGAAGSAAAGPGAAIGSIGLGPLVGGPLGAIAGGAAAGIPAAGAVAFAAKEAKHVLGNYLANSDIPADHELNVFNAMMEGAIPAAFESGAILKQGAMKPFLEARMKAIEKGIGKGVSPELLTKVAKNPELLNGIEDASSGLKDEYQKLFGIDVRGPTESDPRISMQTGHPDQVPQKSVFGQKLKPLREAAAKEDDQLAQNPTANFQSSELLTPLTTIKNQLAAKADLSSEQQAALNYLNQKIDTIKKISGPDNAPLNFKQAKEVLTAAQQDIFQKDAQGNYTTPGGSYLAQSFGGGEGLRSILDQKAQAAGSQLPAINGQMYNILSAYNGVKGELTPQNIVSKFLPGNPDWKSLADKTKVMDQVLGTNYAPQFENGAVQNWLNNTITKSTAQGSSNVNRLMLQQAAAGGIQGGLAGLVAGGAADLVHSPGIGAAVKAAAIPIGAALKANTAAALADPETAIQAWIDAQKRISTPVGEDAYSDVSKPGHVTRMGALKAVESLENKPAAEDQASSAVTTQAPATGGYIPWQAQAPTQTPPAAQGGYVPWNGGK